MKHTTVLSLQAVKHLFFKYKVVQLSQKESGILNGTVKLLSTII